MHRLPMRLGALSVPHAKHATITTAVMAPSHSNSSAMCAWLCTARSVVIRNLGRMVPRDASAASRGIKRTSLQLRIANAVGHSDRVLTYVQNVVNECVTNVHIPLAMGVKILTFFNVKTAVMIQS